MQEYSTNSVCPPLILQPFIPLSFAPLFIYCLTYQISNLISREILPKVMQRHDNLVMQQGHVHTDYRENINDTVLHNFIGMLSFHTYVDQDRVVTCSK